MDNNGVQVRPVVGKARTRNYRSPYGLYPGAFHWALQRGVFTLNDVPAMLYDPTIRICRKTVFAPVSIAKWNTLCEDPQVQQFIDSQIKRIKATSLEHIMTYLDYGYAGGEPIYKDNGIITIDRIKGFAPWDVRPLQSEGELVGMSVKIHGSPGSNGDRTDDTANTNGKVYLFHPKYFWIVNESEFDSFIGKSRMQGAWEPWIEKRGKHGAVDIRRLWFFKNAINGGCMFHPLGQIEVENGTVMDARDYARQIVEYAESGGVMTLPSSTDDKGNRLWEWKPASVNGGGNEFINYPRQLDDEIVFGYEVMPEVIRASETGSGWSGRSVPFMTFLSGEDRIWSNILHSLNPILKFLVECNFGPIPFEVEPISLMQMASGEREPQGVGTDQKELV